MGESSLEVKALSCESGGPGFYDTFEVSFSFSF